MTNKIEPFRALDIAGSGLAAEQRRLEVISGNLANAQTTRSPEGGPYRRREVIFKTVYDGQGDDRAPIVKVAGVKADATDFKRVYKPGHVDADKDGYVTYPNIDAVYEMVDMMEAMRSYEANLRSMKTFKTMADAALQIGR